MKVICVRGASAQGSVPYDVNFITKSCAVSSFFVLFIALP